jgi:hypothetical protein
VPSIVDYKRGKTRARKDTEKETTQRKRSCNPEKPTTKTPKPARKQHMEKVPCHSIIG